MSEQVDDSIKRMMAMAEKAKNDWESKTPEEKQSILDSRERAARKRIEDEIREALERSSAPVRHAKSGELDRSGEWGQTEAKIKDRLGKGFLIALVGIRGNGKTQMAVALMRQNAADKRGIRYITAMAFFMSVKSTYKKESEESEETIIAKFSAPSLLVIDEIGQRSENDWENRLLYELLNRRYNAMKDTLLISNQEVSALESALGPSLISRMRETGGIVECNWESYRK